MGKKREKGPKLETQGEAARRTLLRQALEYVLPPGEAEAACLSLLEAFGGFDGLFAAPEEVIRETPRVGPEAARFVRLVIGLCQTYLEERSWKLQRVYDTPSAVEMFRPKFLGRKTEAVCLMLLDGRGRMVYNDVICEGSVSQVPLYLRRVLQICLQYSAEDVLLAHNHPSGAAFPSQSDLTVTDRLISAMQSIGAQVCDHIIFAGDSYYSFRESGTLQTQLELMLEAQSQELESVRQLGLRMRGQGGGKG